MGGYFTINTAGTTYMVTRLDGPDVYKVTTGRTITVHGHTLTATVYTSMGRGPLTKTYDASTSLADMLDDFNKLLNDDFPFEDCEAWANQPITITKLTKGA
jgi:hypothetical protein